MESIEKEKQKIEGLTKKQQKETNKSVLPSTALKSLQMNIWEIK